MSSSGDLSPQVSSDSSETDVPSVGAELRDGNNLPASGLPESSPPETDNNASLLDYEALTRFLLEPLLDQPEELKISSEAPAQSSKVWVRISLGNAERGRVFGRGGRNIRAIRTIVRAAGKNVGQNVSLDIVGGEGQESHGKPKPRKAGSPRPSKPKPKPKSK